MRPGSPFTNELDAAVPWSSTGAVWGVSADWRRGPVVAVMPDSPAPRSGGTLTLHAHVPCLPAGQPRQRPVLQRMWPEPPRAVPWLATYGTLARPVRSSHRASETFRISARGMPRTEAMCSTSGSSTGPERSSGGAAKTSPSDVRRTGTSPAPHCCTTTSPEGVRSPASQAWQVPKVGHGRREHEGGLRQVHPVSEPLHLLDGKALAVEHDRDRVAAVGRGREDVDLGEGAQHGQSMPGASRDLRGDLPLTAEPDQLPSG
jgi:hypothetical protein